MTSIYVKLEKIEIANSHETLKASHIPDSCKPGTMVAVRPCAEEYAKKTFLGMYLASAPTGFIGHQIGEKIVLRMTDYTNPAIYIPELDIIVWGYESWWGEIKSEKELKQITDESIQNIWYVKALKQLEDNKANSADAKNSAAD